MDHARSIAGPIALLWTLSGAAFANDGQAAAQGAALFRQIAEVLRHPRCMNCHTVTEFPRQGDERRRHHQLVMRGAAGRGAPAMQCSNCHQEANSPDGRVPGSHNWHLAPLSMGWEDLRTDQALCQALVDPKKNGGRGIEQLSHHLTDDRLVQWAWTPGARRPPPIPQREFHDLVRRWAAGGGTCPND